MIKSSGKTPYEIRLELLQLAFDILIQKHQAASAASNTSNPVVTSSPSTEEVIAEAEKLNVFISKANQAH